MTKRPSTRVVVYTGKGGVGKTTVSAATAIASGLRGHRTLVTSTDPAHSVGDSFGVRLGPEPVEVSEGCFAHEMHGRTRMEAGWDEIQQYLTELLRWGGASRIEASELAILPGFEEVLALADIHSLATSGEWDTIVVDCAPTAETIRLLSLPEALSWYMDRAFPLSRRITRIVSPVVSRLSDVPLASPEVFGAVERLYERLSAVRLLLSDPAVAAIRLVMTPERMVVAEAKRTFTYLSMFGYSVDAVVVNRVLPDSVVDPFFAAWRSEQQHSLDAIDMDFGAVPILIAAMASKEIVGVDALRDFQDGLFGASDPTRPLSESSVQLMQWDSDDPVVQFVLTHADRSDLDVAISTDEIVVTYGPYRRCIALPDSFRGWHVRSARLRDDVVRIELMP